MRKKILSGILTAALVFGVGTTGYVVFAHSNGQADNIQNSTVQNVETQPDLNQLMKQQGLDTDEMDKYMEQYGMNYSEMQEYMEEQGIDVDQMLELMESGNINFGQMKPFIQQMHPNLSTEDAKNMYESMHGTTGSSNSRNFMNNMGSFNGMGGM